MDTAAMMIQVQSVAPSPYQEEAESESWTVRNTEAGTAQHVTTLNMTIDTTIHMTQLVTTCHSGHGAPTSSPAVAATVSCAALAPGLGGVEAAEAHQAQPQRGLGCRHGEVEVRCPQQVITAHCSLGTRHAADRGGNNCVPQPRLAGGHPRLL